MKNRKGFTIVELLAVIILLAGVMILIYPNVIEKVSEQEKSIDAKTEKLLYQSTFNYLYKRKSLYPLITGKKYCVKISTLSASDELIVETNKDLLSKGYVQVQVGDGGDTNQDKNAYRIISGSSLCQGDIIMTETIYEDGTSVFFNPVTGGICNDYLEANSKTGVKSGCLKWYTYGDDVGHSTIKLLLDHNTTTSVSWSSTSSNSTNGDSVYAQLELDTSGWKYDADLIDAHDVANIVNYPTWTASSEWFYFESKSTVSQSCKKGKYSWIYDRTADYCEDFGCSNNSDVELEGYWTKTAHSTNNQNAWSIYYDCGELLDKGVNDSLIGVRPVITIPKALLD